ncbi:hypothetical protein M2282_002297 [Variovorax boronicumulans]|uniref:zinc ribbon domain-containing protein n=1 Tax=Variovorax boronicumulans TaxID=436515 RepID=UPI00247632D6|nr:zinc ribbon domain-containing protein [Variovorax boronicumulans]MDH6167148.1 hypothetical protein [Variovorax boronicumulans]
MALICPVCSTENREGANFCKSCGTTLSATASRIPSPPSPEGQADREWATTAPAQLRAPTIPAPLFDLPEPVPSSRGFFGKASADERTAILAPGQSSAPSSSSRAERAERKRSRTKVPRPPEPPEPPLRQRGLVLWLGLLVVAVVMVVAGWYGYGSRKTAEPVDAPPPPVAAPAAAPTAPPAVEPPPLETVAPAAPAAPETPAVEMPAAEAAPVSPAAAPKPAAKPRKQAAAAPQAAAPEAAAPAAATAPPPPAPAAPAEPQALCADRNFIAKAQCMATQCLKPEFKAHAQCEAVRRQQRVEEEKRNPTLIN